MAQQWVDQCGSLLWILNNLSIGSCKHVATSTLDNSNGNKKHNCEIRQNFNTKGCLYKKYSWEPKYSNGNAKDHGAHTYLKSKS